MSHFQKYAGYYNLLNKEKDYAGESAYIHRLIAQHAPNSETILELGCGTGKHALLLAEQGYRMHGIDISDGMLQMAQTELQSRPDDIAARVRFEQGDIRQFRSDSRYDVVISLFHVISYLTADADLEATFGNLSSLLEPGGLFIFDCWHGPAVLAQQPEKRERIFEDEQLRIMRKTTPEHLVDDHVINVHFDFEVTDKHSGTSDTFHELHPMRYLFTGEVHDLLQRHGLKPVAAEEWLSGKPLDDNTWNACYIARI